MEEAVDSTQTNTAEYLVRLDDYLASESAPRGSMMLSDLDGFLTALACGPEAVDPAEWMPVVWGGEEPMFADEAQHTEMESSILRLYGEILQTLKTSEWTIQPLFCTTASGVEVVSDWCEGFMDAVHLRIDAWDPLFLRRKESDYLAPILFHSSTPYGEPYFPDEITENEELRSKMPHLIPAAVDAIYHFWREEALRPRPIRSVPTPGRNDACLCGSGKKYKRCCGS